MFKIDSDTLEISISRGDGGTIGLKANGGEYEFQPNDKIKFNVYEKKGYDKTPLFSKVVTVESATTTVYIPFHEEDTDFVPEINKKNQYWYDVTLNETNTIVGYENSDGERPRS